MKFITKYLLIICFLCSFSSLAVAQASGLNQENSFDLQKANRQFDLINIKLTNQNLNLIDLRLATEKLDRLQSQAQECVDKAENELNSVEKLLKAERFKNKAQQELADYQYLLNKRDNYAKRLSECQLFVFRSKESITALQKTISQLSTSGLLSRGTPIWGMFSKHFSVKFNGKQVYKLSGIKDFALSNLTILIILLVFGIVLGFLLRAIFGFWLNKQKPDHLIRLALLKSLRTFIVPVAFFAILSGFFFTLFFGDDPNPALELFSHAILFYLILLFFANLLFRPAEPTTNPLKFSPGLAKAFFVRTVVVASLFLLGYLFLVIFREQEIGKQTYELVQTILVTVMSFVVIWFCWLITRIPLLKRFNGSGSLLVKLILIVLLLLLVVTEWLGYHNLVLYLITGIFLSLLVLAVFLLAVRIVNELLNVINMPNSFLAEKVRGYLGVKSQGQIIEAIFIRYGFYLLFAVLAVWLLLYIWGVSPVRMEKFRVAIIEGFNIAGANVALSRIMAAFLIFGFLHLFGRLLAAHVARKHQFNAERDTQVAIASIISYVGFAVALLVALLVAGVNFTGLAIIAGALSVGIGLGLQNIVNNFVSGIILLLEKPIKPGDRIVINNTEGFVKKIRIRSTQINTLAKEDVIVPNADLISQQVKNYMFKDSLYRLQCRVGVAYGSDIDKVKEVLLQVAEDNPSVVQDSPNAPIVLFREFGDSALMFELWIVIKNVNDRFIVASELHFAIDKAFRQNHIVIAFPQRDLHIHDWREENKK